jgi:zinc protease
LSIPRSRPLALAGLVLASALVAKARVKPPADPVIPPDPALSAGVLPNGLRYFLLPQGNQPGHVSLRLIVEAGSLDEREDERGYAHFVEHMAFAGTAHYPAGKLVEFFQGLGVGYGADLNADTGFTRTLYKLDLPSSDLLPKALQVLRDYADGLTFAPEAVDRQRGVILSELSARATAQYELGVHWLSLLYAGTPLPARMPIGLASRIEQADALRLRAFYRRCYRPERMLVLVVGDLNPRVAEAALRRQFSGMASADSMAPPARLSRPDSPGLQADAIASPLHTSSAVDFISVAARPGDTVTALRAWEADVVVLNMLNRRLTSRADSNPRLGKAVATADAGPDQWYTHFRLEAQAAANDWPVAVAVLERELRRARQQGFQADEVQEAASSLLANLMGYRDQVATYRPSALADAMTARLATGCSWHDLNAETRLSADFLTHFTPADAATALGGLFTEGNLHLILSRPTPLPNGREALLAAYHASANGVLAAGGPAAPSELLLRYGDSLPAGPVTHQETQPDLRLTTVAFANGVRLNLRPSRGESRRFGLSVRIGRGIADVPRDRPRLEMPALTLLGSADLGRNTQEEIGRLLELHAIQFNAGLEDNQMSFSAAGPAAELPFVLRLVAALLSDLKLNPARLDKAFSQYAAVHRHEIESTSSWGRNETLYRLASSDPRLRLISPVEVSRYPFAAIDAWARQHWLEGPVEIGLTGDIDPAETVAAVARTLGALPPRRNPPVAAAERLTLLTGELARKNEIEPVPDAAASLRLAWPAAAAQTVRDRAALQLAIDAVIDRLRIRVRENLGATYSPNGGLYRYAPQPDFQFAWIELTFDPRHARTLEALTLRLSDELAEQGLTAEEFNRLREPRRAQTAAQLGSDDWWLHQVLVRAQSQPAIVGDARDLATVYDELTREEVNRAAVRYLRAAQASAILVIPQSAAAK